MQRLASDDQDWIEFVENPVGYIDAERLAFCFGGAVPASLCADLLSNSRLEARLNAVIKDHYWLPPILAENSFSESDQTIAMAPSDKLQEIVLRSGIIVWSAAIANTVRANEVSVLHDQIGEELCSYAIKHRDLSGPEKSISPADTILDRIIESGWHCFAAWCETLNPAISARLRLKLAPNDILDSSVESEFLETGAEIVRRAAVGVLQ